MASLKPLKLDKEVKDFKAFSETKTLEFKKCDHSKAKMVGSELRCPCGASWVGPRIQELLKAFTSQT